MDFNSIYHMFKIDIQKMEKLNKLVAENTISWGRNENILSQTIIYGSDDLKVDFDYNNKLHGDTDV